MRTFIAGVSLVLLAASLSVASAPVSFQMGESYVDVTVGSQRVARCIFDSNLPKPSLVNVTSLGGREVTRRWPLTELAGGSMDHHHHVGISFCVDRVNGTNFWNYYKNPDGKNRRSAMCDLTRSRAATGMRGRTV